MSIINTLTNFLRQLIALVWWGTLSNSEGISSFCKVHSVLRWLWHILSQGLHCAASPGLWSTVSSPVQHLLGIFSLFRPNKPHFSSHIAFGEKTQGFSSDGSEQVLCLPPFFKVHFLFGHFWVQLIEMSLWKVLTDVFLFLLSTDRCVTVNTGT